MKKGLTLKFFDNGRGVPVGDLYVGERAVLSTTHPATIAAAIFSMDGEKLSVKTELGTCAIGFPVLRPDLEKLNTIASEHYAQFLSAFATFSYFDFSNPEPWDNQAEIHFRTAVHHLPAELVQVRPEGPQPKDWKKQLKRRNRFVYYPPC